jgi:hypothetical protein
MGGDLVSADYVTDEQIRALGREANRAGDDVQYAIATIALELDADRSLGAQGFEARFGGGGLRLSPRDRSKLERTTASEAWDECARVILGRAR